MACRLRPVDRVQGNLMTVESRNGSAAVEACCEGCGAETLRCECKGFARVIWQGISRSGSTPCRARNPTSAFIRFLCFVSRWFSPFTATVVTPRVLSREALPVRPSIGASELEDRPGHSGRRVGLRIHAFKLSQAPLAWLLSLSSSPNLGDR